MKYTAILLGLLLAPAAAVAEIAPEIRWSDPSHVVLDVQFPGDGYHANWELFRCECGDLLVHSELNVPGEAEVGETLMVHRKAVLSDVVNGVRLVDALPNMDFVMSMFLPSDVPRADYERHQMSIMLQESTKPIIFVGVEADSTVTSPVSTMPP